jgi:omega-amidase
MSQLPTPTTGRNDRRLIHAHLVQLDIAWEDPSRNHESVRQLLDRATVEPGDFVLLPEMFDTGFSFNVERTNDKSGRTLSFLTELADDLKVVVQGGRTIAACHKCAASNVMTAIAPALSKHASARVLAEYTKIHPFQKEADRFEPGREVMTYDLPGINADAPLRICPAICYDLRFPELFRVGLSKGAEVFALGACWPNVRQEHWRALLIARAIENQAIVLGCNRTGDDPALHYAGGSIAIGPKGEILGELGAEVTVLSVPVDVQSVRAWRESFRAWKDQRISIVAPSSS